jgi:hypothetical protein
MGEAIRQAIQTLEDTAGIQQRLYPHVRIVSPSMHAWLRKQGFIGEV